jgi:hypothetical protein
MRKNKLENHFALKSVVAKQKIKNITKNFIDKLKRNNEYSLPI